MSITFPQCPYGRQLIIYVEMLSYDCVHVKNFPYNAFLQNSK